MPERQNRMGDIANDRLIALLEALGWNQQGDSDVDIPCELSAHHERDADHGVDGYMAYDDPYRTRERGVVIESKAKSWENTNDTSIQDGATQALETLECIPESDEFDEYLNNGEDRNVDLAILGVWVHDGEYDDSMFDGYVNELAIKNKRRKPFQVLVLGNRELHRLASLHNQFSGLKETEFDGQYESLDFYYPSLPDTVSDRGELVALEYMISDYVFAKGQKVVGEGPESDSKDVNLVFYFDDIQRESLDFMFKALLEYQMTDADEIWVYLDTRDQTEDFQIGSLIESFRQNVLPEDAPEFRFERLTQVNYDTYVDGMRGESL
ncbi:hypothetical protein [Halobacterium salinarum]|uniref:hypothetical protein n=1 Tax=Halobacterium salinarum TaxID=2242 RepID=UPI002553A5A9|nr:hypothetical protein [Halobacterium salinarum]MDL0125686.1 hypothetical protein [Halobacterium salinarum]MDL0145605.1 hypothetical protein [Halobacterium salinarum]